MKASKKVFVVMALAVVFCIWGHPASAGNPDQQTVFYPCVELVDLYADPLEFCFGVTDQLHLDACLTDVYNCSNACNTQRVADETACSRISDPVEQANCLALADLNYQMCINNCGTEFEAGWCP